MNKRKQMRIYPDEKLLSLVDKFRHAHPNGEWLKLTDIIEILLTDYWESKNEEKESVQAL